MHAFAITAHAPEARFPSANRWGTPVVPTNFQPSAPCSGGGCCPDCSQAPAYYLARDIEARPRIPSAFRPGMQGLGHMVPRVPGSYEPAAAARRLPGTGPEEWRPEGFHGLGAVAWAAPHAQIVAASNAIASTGLAGSEFAASGLHRLQVVYGAAKIIGAATGGAVDAAGALADYRRSICDVDGSGVIIPGSGDIARGRTIVTTILGGAGRLLDLIDGRVADQIVAALNLVKNEIGELENEIRARCEHVSLERRGVAPPPTFTASSSNIIRELLRRRAAAAQLAGMSTGTKVAIGAVGLGLFGALVYAIAK